MTSPPLTLAIVGGNHPNKRGPTRRFEIALCQPGEPIQLIPEPRNPHDRNAIAVFSVRDIQLGYVSAERAPLIGKRLRENDVVAVFQEATEYGALIRLSFDGSIPALPEPRPQEAEPPDFWPDEEWPEE